MVSDADTILISRLIDGDLTPAESSALKERMLQEPELRQLYDALSSTHQLLTDMVDLADEQPLPAIDQPKPFAKPLFAIAASLAMVAVVIMLITFEPSPNNLQTALNDLPSGQSASFEDGRIEVIATFRTERGWCREYVTGRERAVACLEDANWQTVISESVVPVDATSYQPAGSGSSVQQYVMENLVGQVADEEQERRLLESW